MGSNPAEAVRIFQGEKILSTPPFGGEVKPLVPCRRFAACERSLNWHRSGNFRQNYWLILTHVVPPFATRISRIVVDVGVRGGKRGNVQTDGGDRVSTISLLGCSTSVALATGPTDEEEELDALFVLSLFYQLTSTCFGHIRSIPIPANRQSTEKHNTYQLLYIYSIPPDDGLQICLKHVEVDWRKKLRIDSASSWFSLHGSIVHICYCENLIFYNFLLKHCFVFINLYCFANPYSIFHQFCRKI